MQTERVTFLTTPDHKAALDAFAISNGRSGGHVLREAASRYLAEGHDRQPPDQEEALALLAAELNEAAPRMQEALARSNDTLEALHAEMDAFFRDKGIA